jgi:superfamily II DNA or RNA helicase
MTPFDEALAQLEKASEGKGQAFEKAVKWWLQYDSIWSGKFDPSSVKLWSESPHRTGPDVGIDLTATDRGGGHWAIQVKNWQPSRAIPKSEVDSFLSASSTSDFVGRLLVTTTNEISRNAIRTISEQEKPCVVVTRTELADSVVWAQFGQQESTFSMPKPRAPLPHQQEAIDSLLRHFEEGESKGQLIMACGSGKTLTGQRFAEAMGSKRTLVLVPSLLLLQQTLVSWRLDRANDFDFVAVCSDESVGKDEFSKHVVDLPFPVTTDANEIARILRQSDSLVVFATYQSSQRVAEALELVDQEFELVIADEAHRLAGVSDGAYGTLLRQGKIPSARYLFMTATPKIFGKRSKTVAEKSGQILWSMDNEKDFGKEVYTYSFSRAIKEDRLTDYRVIVMGVRDDALLARILERELVRVEDSNTDLLSLAAHVGLARAMEKYKVKRLISFHSRVAKARDFAEFHVKARSSFIDTETTSRSFYGATLSGKDSASQRKTVLDRLANVSKHEYGLVSNSRCLTEGIDVPSLDGIAFIDPRSSQVDIVQAVGRAIRKSGGGKAIGHIIIPVFVSSEEEAEGKLETGKYQPVWEVINALKAHDETLKVELDSLRQQLGREGTISRWIDKIVLDLPVELPASFASEIEAMLLENSTESWEEMFGKAEAFASQKGHIRINRESNQPEKHRKLGAWVTKQRSDFRRGSVSRQRASQLEGLPGWEWEPFDVKWQEGLAALKEFVKENGHARAPARKKFREFSLGSWVSKKRDNRWKMSEERRSILEAFPGWTWDSFEARWNLSIEYLESLVEEEGTLKLIGRQATFEDGRSVGGWIIKQRVDRDILSIDKILRLERLLGWTWDPFQDKWDASLMAIDALVTREGSVSGISGINRDENGVNLWNFVQNQRTKFRAGQISIAEQNTLEAIPGWTWNSRDQEWITLLTALRKFVELNGRLPNAKMELQDGVGVSRFATRTRFYFYEGTLKPWKKNLIEDIPGWSWDPGNDSWNKALAEVEGYVSTHGRLPTDKVAGVSMARLDSWLYQQRKVFERLDDSQRTKLSMLRGFEPLSASLTKEQSWQQNLKDAKEFVAEENMIPSYRSKSPKSDKVLGLWLDIQKRDFLSLSEKQTQGLMEIPGFKPQQSKSEKWYTKFVELEKHISNEGSLPPLRRGGRDLPAGAWMRRQFKSWGTLTHEQQHRLSSLPGFTDEKERAST